MHSLRHVKIPTLLHLFSSSDRGFVDEEGLDLLVVLHPVQLVDVDPLQLFSHLPQLLLVYSLCVFFVANFSAHPFVRNIAKILRTKSLSKLAASSSSR
jgi:hypothetical protein